MKTERRIAIVTGALFIIATAASLIGSSLTGSVLTAPAFDAGIFANGNPIMLGALLTFIAAAASAGIAIALYPVLRRYYEGLALGAVGFRLIEAVFYMVGAICPVLLFTVSQEFMNAGAQATFLFQNLRHSLLTVHDLAAFVFGVLAFCVGALMYYYIFYQTKLIPRWLSIWGLVAIVALLSAALFTAFDGEPFSISGNLILLALPIALQEMVLAVWLIVKGFNPAAIASESAGEDMTPYQLAPQH